ncbi:hypothetical protein ACFE04_030719 [Oxalis oulophora]
MGGSSMNFDFPFDDDQSESDNYNSPGIPPMLADRESGVKGSEQISSSSGFHRAGTLKKLPFISGEFAINYRPSQRCHGRNIFVKIYSETTSTSSGMGKLSERAHLKYWRTEDELKIYRIKLYIEENFGRPVAFDIENKDSHSLFLAYATINAAGSNDNHFDCNSWVYPIALTGESRTFFANTCYLPSKTPRALKQLRGDELFKLCDFRSGERKEHDRAYDYDCYNDLGIHDGGREHRRLDLGNNNLPYPRRIKTGYRPSKEDTSSENQSQRTIFDTYVPPDERLTLKKQKELILNIINVTIHFIIPILPNSSQSFESFDEIRRMFTKLTEEEWKKKEKEEKAAAVRSRPTDSSLTKMVENITEQFDKMIQKGSTPIYKLQKCREGKSVNRKAQEILRKLVPSQFKNDITHLSHAPRKSFLIPQIIIENEDAWRDDREFARQMLAGTNPTRIQSLKKKKEIDEAKQIHETDEILKWACKNHDSLRNDPEHKGLYILDHYGYLMPFLLNRINSTGIHAYASRTILLKEKDETLKPIAIELCLPNASSIIGDKSIWNGSSTDETRSVFYPPSVTPLANAYFTRYEMSMRGTYTENTDKKDEALWQLAKAHVAANDCVYHQLISHWLHTHAVVEPFIIATRRCLSVMHPIHRLLHPHFKDTMHINALARSTLLNAGGIFERILFTGKFSMELSSELYKAWRFDKQALPEDLKARGMAIDSTTNSTGVVLVLKDYPYASDGLEIWMAIKEWVKKFCSHFYHDDKAVTDDYELEGWWYEVQKKGHPEITEGWYELTSITNLTMALTTLIWITSGLHASVNFGQYAYAGYPPNRPTLCRKAIPKEDSREFAELLNDPDKFLLDTFPKKFEAALAISLLHVLSYHTSDEVYLGLPATEYWIDDQFVIQEFCNFREKLKEIEENILTKNRGEIPCEAVEKYLKEIVKNILKKNRGEKPGEAIKNYLKEIEINILKENRGEQPGEAVENYLEEIVKNILKENQGEKPREAVENYLEEIVKNILEENRRQKPLEAVENYLKEIEKNIMKNKRGEKSGEAVEKHFLNRWGLAKIPYKLLCPDTSEIGSAKGVTGRGIPNSISI